MKLIKDKFTERRGNYSRLYNIACGKCAKFIVYYQKDGPGILKRLYLDRINPGTNYRIKTKFLVCPKCKDLLGAKCIYPREKRPAIELFVGAIKKTPTKA